MRKSNGSSIVEAAVAISVLLPVVIVVVFAVLEASYAYSVKQVLAQAASQAARGLAIAYADDPTVAGSRDLQEIMVFDGIKFPGIINDSDQFEDPTFDTSIEPSLVTVIVNYTPNQYGLDPMPGSDVLGLGSILALSASSSYRL